MTDTSACDVLERPPTDTGTGFAQKEFSRVILDEIATGSTENSRLFVTRIGSSILYNQIPAMDRPEDLHDLRLPSVLERRDRAIRVRGHRTTLAELLGAWDDTHRLRSEWSIGEKIQFLIFRSVNHDRIADYVEAQADIASRNAKRQPYSGPSKQELLRRLGHGA